LRRVRNASLINLLNRFLSTDDPYFPDAVIPIRELGLEVGLKSTQRHRPTSRLELLFMDR